MATLAPPNSNSSVSGSHASGGSRFPRTALVGGVVRQLFKERRVHEVAGVQDQVRKLQVGQQTIRKGPGTAREMRIRDDGGELPHISEASL